MVRSTLIGLAALMMTSAAHAVEIEGNKNLPPCDWRTPMTQDCHITGPDVAINLMANPPLRDLQPNAYSEFRQYERERERNSMGSKVR